MICRKIFYLLLIFTVIPFLNSCSRKANSMNTHSLCFEKVITSEPVLNNNGQLISFMDSMLLHLEIRGKEVTGSFDWSPSKTKFIKGTLKGIIENNLVKAVYTYKTSEGVQIKEERYIKLEHDSAYFRIGGKMRLRDGIYVYANDQSNMQFGAAIPQKYCRN